MATEAQKRARDAWNKKIRGRYKGLTVTLPTEELEASRELMGKYGKTPAQVWRAGIKAIQKENH